MIETNQVILPNKGAILLLVTLLLEILKVKSRKKEIHIIPLLITMIQEMMKIAVVKQGDAEQGMIRLVMNKVMT